MKIERDERRFDFRDIGLAIKRAREAAGMTQEQLAYIVDRAPRTIMYNENDGQHPSLNTFYQMVTMFDISVDQYFYPSKNKGSECRKRIDAMLGSLDEKELKIVEATIQAMKAAKETEDAQKCLLGSSPNPPDFWTLCPEVLVVCGPALSLLGLIPLVRMSEQMVDVPLDGHGLPHIRLGLAVFRVKGFFLFRQFPPLLFQRVHFGELRPV